MIVEYKIRVTKSTAIKLYEFRKKMCFHEVRILNFFVDIIVILKFRFLLKGILVENVFINIIFDLLISVFLTFNIILIYFNKKSPLKFIIIRFKRIFIIIIVVDVCVLLTKLILILLKRLVYVFVDDL